MNEHDLLVKLGFESEPNGNFVVPDGLNDRYMYCPTYLTALNMKDNGWQLWIDDTLLVDCKPFNVMYEVASVLLRKL